MAEFPTQEKLTDLLEGLLGKDVALSPAGRFEPHPSTTLGLVDNEDNLMYVLGSDIAFAHRTGAALAMMPAGGIDSVDDPDEDLIEVYHEVANVLSRAVNEASPTRVRLDPGMEIASDQLSSVTVAAMAVTFSVSVAGYGDGSFGIWAT